MPVKKTKKKKRRGNCYVTVEALFYLMGGKKSGLVPHWVKHEGDTHWYLVKRDWIPVPRGLWSEDDTVVRNDIIIDPTVKQFRYPPPYYKGKACGFLTKKPSKRARALMESMLWQSK